MINHLLLALGLFVGGATLASAELAPTQPETVADAVADCWAAVGANGLDMKLLGQRGWRAGSMTAPGGKPVETSLQVYGKAGSNVVLMLMGAAPGPACTVTAKVGSATDVSLAAQAVQRRLTSIDPQTKTARSGASVVFLALPRIAMFDATGTKAQPSIRAVVSFQKGERG